MPVYSRRYYSPIWNIVLLVKSIYCTRNTESDAYTSVLTPLVYEDRTMLQGDSDSFHIGFVLRKNPFSEGEKVLHTVTMYVIMFEVFLRVLI